jgi:hypothetical protein
VEAVVEVVVRPAKVILLLEEKRKRSGFTPAKKSQVKAANRQLVNVKVLTKASSHLPLHLNLPLENYHPMHQMLTN